MRRVIGLTVACLLVASPGFAATFGDGGAALDGVLDGITLAPTAGSTSVNVTTDEIDDSFDSLWSITGAGGSVATIIVELAAFAGTNQFGVYDASNPANKVVVFAGADAPGAQKVITIMADGSVKVNFVDTGIDFASGNLFGFFLDSSTQATGGVFHSDTSLNSDGLDHMYAYQGTNTDTIQPHPTIAAGLWTDNEFVLAFEDLDASVSDKDYTDFVVIVESVIPVIPEPGTMILLGTGIAGLALARRRRRDV